MARLQAGCNAPSGDSHERPADCVCDNSMKRNDKNHFWAESPIIVFYAFSMTKS
jgi:hypothetical protein